MRTALILAALASLLSSPAHALRGATEIDTEHVMRGDPRSPTCPSDQGVILETPRQGHPSDK